MVLLGTVGLPLSGLAQAEVDQHPVSRLQLSSIEYARLPAEAADWHADFTSLDDVEFRPLRPQDWNQGVTGDVFWLRFAVHNPTDQPVAWILQYETSYLDSMVLYWRDQENPSTAGAVDDVMAFQRVAINRPDGFAARPMEYRKPTLRVVTPAGGTTDLRVRLQQMIPDAVSLRVQVSEERLFNQVAYRHTLLQGGYFGALLSL
ncbi:MAG: 7TM-DISM domain-containing protein, partial [Natronospirillum sp.]